MDTISIVIPIYNENENINRFLKEAKIFLYEKIISFEFVFVDDGSSDNSFELIKNNDLMTYNIKYIKLSRNFGSHAAVRAGILHSIGDFIIPFSVDLQDPIEIITKMYKKIVNNYDMIIAEREYKNTVLKYFNFSYINSIIVRSFINRSFPLNGFDVIMFNKKIKDVLNNNIEANSNYALQLLNYGFKIDSIKYTKKNRYKGKSKWTISKKIKLLIDTFVAFSYLPIRAVTITGLIFSIIAFFWTLYIILRTIFKGDLSPGWPALISILLFGFGLTNISLGIIAEYLWRTLDAARKRPPFIIDEIIELNKKQ